jgi:transposase-like protein
MSKKQKESKSDQRQFWQMVIETWQNSGMSVSKFCKDEGLSEGSFYNWRKRLAKGDKSEAAKQKEQSSSAFIEVSMPPEKPGGLELVLTSGNTLRICLGADSTTLTNVLLALCEAGLC